VPHGFRGLALHTWTVDTTPLDQALAAAKAGGFDAVELRRVDFERCQTRGLSNPAVLDLVRAAGLPVSALGVEYGWIFSTGATSTSPVYWRRRDVNCVSWRSLVASVCSAVTACPGRTSSGSRSMQPPP